MGLKEFGNLLADVIAQAKNPEGKHMTQAYLAERLGVRNNTITDWIKAKKRIEPENVHKLAQILGFNEVLFWLSFGPPDPMIAVAAEADRRGMPQLSNNLAYLRRNQIYFTFPVEVEPGKLTDEQIRAIIDLSAQLIRGHAEYRANAGLNSVGY